jgi:hypothetical protein
MMNKKLQARPVDEKERQFRIFVSSVNAVVGQAIVENLRNDNYNDDNPHIIIGTLDKDDPTPACRGVKRIVGVAWPHRDRRPALVDAGDARLRRHHLRRPQGLLR